MPEIIHIVTAGSTLGGIAKKFGVPLGVLIDVNGITDPNKPLPFLVKGTIESASVHIVNYQDDGKPMTKEKVGVLKTRFNLSNEPVEVLGFRSSRHATNPGNIHMHARTANAIYHIDEVKLAAGATLYLPER